jgi:alpha-D-ribose 1-methylphosphonate 5-triphosphate synthase subunit PhnG
MELSRIISESDISYLKEAASIVAEKLAVKVLSDPDGGMVMVRHIDPLENTPFHLGEAYVTECKVEVDGLLGYGCVLGYEQDRALYAAILDAVVGNHHPVSEELAGILEMAEAALTGKRREESRYIGSTKVDFEVR